MDREYLTALQLATRLNVCVRTIWSWTAAGKLPRPLRIGRTVRWRASQIDPLPPAPSGKKRPTRRHTRRQPVAAREDPGS